VKRSELKRSTPLKRTPLKPKARIPQWMRLRTLGFSQNRCVVCDTNGAWVPLQLHHVLPQSQWPEYDQWPDNLVAVCPGCHDNHERAHRRIRYDELPEQVRTWVRTLGGRENMYLERTYPRVPKWPAARRENGRRADP
jgi:5-methylcytosine-specific restriction endonuclease McrA